MAKQTGETSEFPRERTAQDRLQDPLEPLRRGDSRAATEVFDRYVARLVSLARSRLGAALRRRVDPEDVVQSAYRSFFVRAGDGQFEVGPSGDLWRLLAQITLNKVRKQAERHTAARRDLRRDEPTAEEPFLAASGPTPDEAASLIEQTRLLFERLSSDDRIALEQRLNGGSVEEIAERLGRSPRTIRRSLQRAQVVAEAEAFRSEDQPADALIAMPPLATPLPYSDFRLERLIGAGGMGKVYRAVRHTTGKTVAVKALRKDRQTDARAVRQFLHEAEVISRIKHAGVIGVHGLGRFPSGGYFIVLEWVDGADLQAILDQQPVGGSEAFRIIRAVAEAIFETHAAGVVHCDLKPANILLGSDGRVVVTDFGFAQLVADNAQQTSVGGTLGYLAPELLEPCGRPSPAVDLYSLGRIAERMGWTPSGRLGELLRRCTSREPSDRPASASELLAGFDDAREDA